VNRAIYPDDLARSSQPAVPEGITHGNPTHIECRQPVELEALPYVLMDGLTCSGDFKWVAHLSFG
jgi:hypothetical protein